jgi:hypothetical protein
MSEQHPPPQSAVTVAPRRTLEDRLLKFIEGHNPHIWATIAVIAVMVVWIR